jgi:uncharacterized protein (DUF849 family)
VARKIIITCAVTGAGDSVHINPAVPVTPADIARECLEAAAAGAAIVHIHVRDPATGKQSMEYDHYAGGSERLPPNKRKNNKGESGWPARSSSHAP